MPSSWLHWSDWKLYWRADLHDTVTVPRSTTGRTHTPCVQYPVNLVLVQHLWHEPRTSTSGGQGADTPPNRAGVTLHATALHGTTDS
jgi:hypothetical protein